METGGPDGRRGSWAWKMRTHGAEPSQVKRTSPTLGQWRKFQLTAANWNLGSLRRAWPLWLRGCVLQPTEAALLQGFRLKLNKSGRRSEKDAGFGRLLVPDPSLLPDTARPGLIRQDFGLFPSNNPFKSNIYTPVLEFSASLS